MVKSVAFITTDQKGRAAERQGVTSGGPGAEVATLAYEISKGNTRKESICLRLSEMEDRRVSVWSGKEGFFIWGSVVKERCIALQILANDSRMGGGHPFTISSFQRVSPE